METFNSRDYQWKELKLSGNYINSKSLLESPIPFDTELILQVKPYFADTTFIDDFIREFKSYTISKISKSLIENLFEHYKLSFSKEAFYLLAAIVQKNHIYYYENPFAPHFIKEFKYDIEQEYMETEQLLDLLHVHLKGELLNSTKALTFKFDNKVNNEFKNGFIFNTLFTSLITYYGLSLENFNKRKEEILEDKTNIKLSSVDEFQKLNLIRGLYDFINKNSPTPLKKNDRLRFVGIFLHISQIPASSKSSEIILEQKLLQIVTSSDINNLNIYIKNKKSLFIRKVK